MLSSEIMDSLKGELVLEKVLEVISDVPMLATLSQVSKPIRNALLRSNGLREIQYSGQRRDFGTSKRNCVVLNGVHISDRSEQAEKVRQAIRWLWTVGKMKSLKLEFNVSNDILDVILMSELRYLALKQGVQRIEKIKLSRGQVVYAEAESLVQKYCSTLRKLSVKSHYFPPLYGPQLEFWQTASQCSQLERLHIQSNCSPEIFQLAFKAPLRCLRINVVDSSNDSIQVFTDALVSSNLNSSLECMRLISHLDNSLKLKKFVASYRQSATLKPFDKIVELQSDLYDFEEIDWQVCRLLFPVLQKIKFIQLGGDIAKVTKNYFISLSGNQDETKIQVEIKTKSLLTGMEEVKLMRKVASSEEGGKVAEQICVQKYNEDAIESVVLKKGSATLDFRLVVKIPK